MNIEEKNHIENFEKDSIIQINDTVAISGALYSVIQLGTVLVSALYSDVQWVSVEVCRTVQWRTVCWSVKMYSGVQWKSAKGTVMFS